LGKTAGPVKQNFAFGSIPSLDLLVSCNRYPIAGTWKRQPNSQSDVLMNATFTFSEDDARQITGQISGLPRTWGSTIAVTGRRDGLNLFSCLGDARDSIIGDVLI